MDVDSTNVRRRFYQSYKGQRMPALALPPFLLYPTHQMDMPVGSRAMPQSGP
jgi:hypothetical protein